MPSEPPAWHMPSPSPPRIPLRLGSTALSQEATEGRSASVATVIVAITGGFLCYALAMLLMVKIMRRWCPKKPSADEELKKPSKAPMRTPRPKSPRLVAFLGFGEGPHEEETPSVPSSKSSSGSRDDSPTSSIHDNSSYPSSSAPPSALYEPARADTPPVMTLPVMVDTTIADVEENVPSPVRKKAGQWLTKKISSVLADEIRDKKESRERKAAQKALRMSESSPGRLPTRNQLGKQPMQQSEEDQV